MATLTLVKVPKTANLTKIWDTGINTSNTRISLFLKFWILLELLTKRYR